MNKKHIIIRKAFRRDFDIMKGFVAFDTMMFISAPFTKVRRIISQRKNRKKQD